MLACRKWIWAGNFFFRVLVEIFSTYFSTRDECRDIRQVSKKVEKIETSTREKNCPSKFHFCKRQHSIQTYIGNFVYQGVTLNTLGNNGLNKSLGNNGLSRSILVTSGLSMQKSNSVGTCAENSAEKWLGVQKSKFFCTRANWVTFLHAKSLFRTVWRAYMKKYLILKSVKSNSLIHKTTYVRLFWMLASANEIWACFFLVLLSVFWLFFSTLDECLNIFDTFFYPRYSLHSGWKIHRKCLNIFLCKKTQALETKNARFCISAGRHSQHTYINSYFHPGHYNGLMSYYARIPRKYDYIVYIYISDITRLFFV